MGDLSVDGLGRLIVREHEAAEAAAVRAIEHAIEAGRLLAEAKSRLSHGEFGGFVESLGTVSQRTATLYMRLYRRQEELGDRQRVAGLSVREADRLLRLPVTGDGQAGSVGGRRSARQRAEEAVADRVAEQLGHGLEQVGEGAVAAAGQLLVWFEEGWVERPEAATRQAFRSPGGELVEVDLPAGVGLPTLGGSVKSGGCPSWYRVGQWAEGVHVDGWLVDVWPHPAGAQWVHWAAAVPGVCGASHMIGAKRGVRLERLRWAMAGRDGLPDVEGPGWDWLVRPMKDGDGSPTVARYNTKLYGSAAEYGELELA